MPQSWAEIQTHHLPDNVRMRTFETEKDSKTFNAGIRQLPIIDDVKQYYPLYRLQFVVETFGHST